MAGIVPRLMRPLYVMLSVAGWVWLAVLCGYVAWRVARGRKMSRGPDALDRKEP